MKRQIIITRDKGKKVSIDAQPLVQFFEALNRKENYILREEMIGLMKHLCDKIPEVESNTVKRLQARLFILMTYSQLLSGIKVITGSAR